MEFVVDAWLGSYWTVIKIALVIGVVVAYVLYKER